MNQLLPVLLIVGIVTIIMIRQISKVSQQAGDLQVTPITHSFEFYTKFSSIIQDRVRAIKQALDSTKESSLKSSFKLKNSEDEPEALEMLSDIIRKLVFFETAMAKQKSSSEIESDLFALLNELETFLIQYCENGEILAEELREDLLNAYNQLSS